MDIVPGVINNESDVVLNAGNLWVLAPIYMCVWQLKKRNIVHMDA